MPTHYFLNTEEMALIKALRSGDLTRVEVIERDAGRVFVADRTLTEVRLQIQDEGRTLKIFCRRQP